MTNLVAPHMAVFAALGSIGTRSQTDLQKVIGALMPLQYMKVRAEHVDEVILEADKALTKLHNDDGQYAGNIYKHISAARDQFVKNNKASSDGALADLHTNEAGMHSIPGRTTEIGESSPDREGPFGARAESVRDDGWLLPG